MAASAHRPSPSARQVGFQAFLDQLESYVVLSGCTDMEAKRTGQVVFDRLRESMTVPEGVVPGPLRLPVCEHFASAVTDARRHVPDLVAVLDAFEAIEPALCWHRRPHAYATGSRFANGHANAIVVGPGGIVSSDAVRIGVSMMAPHTTYPDHDHPPEEIYVVMSPGEWRRRDDDWFTPGVGGIVYNPPGITHAMRSGTQPLLAVWGLLLST